MGIILDAMRDDDLPEVETGDEQGSAPVEQDNKSEADVPTEYPGQREHLELLSALKDAAINSRIAAYATAMSDLTPSERMAGNREYVAPTSSPGVDNEPNVVPLDSPIGGMLSAGRSDPQVNDSATKDDQGIDVKRPVRDNATLLHETDAGYYSSAPQQGTYQVGSGQSLWSIAAQLEGKNASLQDIADRKNLLLQDNPWAGNDNLKAGQRLILSPSGTPVSSDTLDRASNLDKDQANKRAAASQEQSDNYAGSEDAILAGKQRAIDDSNDQSKTGLDNLKAGKPVFNNALLDGFTKGVEGNDAKLDKERIQKNIFNYLNQVKQDAQTKYGKDNVIGPALEQNAAMVRIYGVLAKVMPDFQWTDVGAFMAHQVRDEVINIQKTGTLGSNVARNGFPTLGPVGPLVGDVGEAARDAAISKLITGQRDVVEDLVGLAIGYKIHGAKAMQDACPQMYGPGSKATSAFETLGQADAARKNGDSSAAEFLGNQGAFFLGVHEQNRLQKMWDDPELKVFAKANEQALNSSNSDLARPISIYVGANKYTDRPDQSLGNIVPPNNLPNKDVSQLETRIRIAQNAFDFIRRARQDPEKFRIMQDAFGKMQDSRNLYQLSY